MNISSEVKLSYLFFGGIALQFIFLSNGWQTLRNKKNILKVIGCFLISLYAFIRGGSFEIHNVIMFFACFAALTAWFFRKEILPQICEYSVLQISIIVWYVIGIGTLSQLNNIFSLFLFIIIFIFTLSAIFLAFTTYQLDFTGKLFFYSYYLLIILIMAIPSIEFVFHVYSAIDNGNAYKIDSLDCIASGMIFFYVVSHISYLLMLIPLPGNHQSFADRWKNVKAYANELVAKYDEQQIKIRESIIIIIFQSGILAINYFFNLMSDVLAITISVILMQITLLRYRKIAAPAKPRKNNAGQSTVGAHQGRTQIHRKRGNLGSNNYS